MLYLYLADPATHLCPVASNFAVDDTQARGLLSVYTAKWLTYKYSWSTLVTAPFRAKNSTLCVGYFDSALLTEWLT